MAAATAPGAPGPLALVGSGEYLPEMAAIEGRLLAGRPPRYVQLATAAVPDGPEVVARWHALGTAQARRLGAEPVILDVATRSDAEDPTIAATVAGAGLIYLSGGKPSYLADTLRDTALWTAIVDAWRSGAALAGCSAGAMVLATRVPAIRSPGAESTAGLGLLPHLQVIPHFDAFFGRSPECLAPFLADHDPAVQLVGVDERTALVGGPARFTVEGAGAAWLLSREGRQQIVAGATVTIAPASTRDAAVAPHTEDGRRPSEPR